MEQHLPFRIQEATEGVRADGNAWRSKIPVDNYPSGFSYRTRQQAPETCLREKPSRKATSSLNSLGF